MPDGITGIVNKKLGLGGETAMMSDVSERLGAALDRLIKTKEIKQASDIVKTLIEEDKKESPFGPLRDVGFDLTKIMEINQKWAADAMKQLEEERNRKYEAQLKALEMEKSDQKDVLNLAMQLVTAFGNMQAKSTEQQVQLLREMYDKIEQVKANQRSPLLDFMENLSLQLLKERLTPQEERKPLEEFKSGIQMMKDLQNLVLKEIGPAGNSISEAIEREKLKLEYAYKEKMLELEEKKWKKQSEIEEAMQKQRIDSLNTVLTTFKELVPAVVGLFAKQGGINTGERRAVASNGQPRIICASCGEEISVPVGYAGMVRCPTCGSERQVMPDKNVVQANAIALDI